MAGTAHAEKAAAALHDHDTQDHDDTHDGEVTGLTLDTWFPFCFLVFGCIIASAVAIAWAGGQIKQGNYLALPVLLLGLAGILLSPVLAHYLNLGVWYVLGGKGLFFLGLGVVVLGGVVGWLWVEVSVLREVVEELRGELAVARRRA